ncbi:MAG: AMP-binding protein [Deltaproteobacteria bacterium]|jgi:long-subunit acyl-CoA synthetase (AMP-forming)|nr:AMP-binding protein [Deltaproteobacteria bacterium]MBW2535166.1 AMP-binding protein [Deltaproteobacteria bacterium]
MSSKPAGMPLESLYRHAEERPDDVYMIQPLGGGAVREYSWRETLEQSRRMAAYLKAHRFAPGSTISILSKNCAEFNMSVLAIWMAGYTASAIYPTLDPDTVSYILTHSESKLLYVGKLDVWDQIAPGVPEELPKVSYSLSPPNDFPSWSEIVEQTEPVAGQPSRDADDLALLFYTSGSTGQPKGVETTFGHLAAAYRGIVERFPLGPEDRYLSYLPMAHVMETALGLNLALGIGGQVFFAESLDTFVQDLQRSRPTCFASVPRLWLKFQQGVFEKMPPKKLERLLKIPILRGIVRKKVLRVLGLDQVRYALTGSAPVPPEVVSWYRNLGLELLEAYGMTENLAYSHCSLPGKTRLGYVGHPMPGVECKIGDNDEILVRSPTTMRGYHKMPEATAEAITEDGWLRTGDQGTIDERGRLKIIGRVKELFKTSKGKYVHPVPIESLLNADEHVELSLVSGVGQAQPVAIVMLAEQLRARTADPAVREQITRDLTELRNRVNDRLVSFERLGLIAVAKDDWSVESGTLTPTMKIKRSEIEKLYQPLFDDWFESGEPVVWHR